MPFADRRETAEKGELQVRLIKSLGLTAVAAIAAMAFVGASSAMAESTALCTANELPCQSANIYTGHVEATATNPTLKTNVATITCESSTILGNALGLGNPLIIHLELLDLIGSCKTAGGTACEFETLTPLGLLSVLKKLNTMEGTVSFENTWVLVKCGFLIHCEYGGTFTVGTALSSTTPLTTTSLALIHASATTGKKETLAFEGCPNESVWTALYTIQLPHQIFISE
jgi:hypothetical protein